MADFPGDLGPADNVSGSDRPASRPQPVRFRQPVGRAEEHLFHFRQIGTDEEKLADLDEAEVDGVLAALNDRSQAELPGVDMTAIKQADPEFEDEAFRAIARETFYKVREARRLQNPAETAELLSSQLQSELENAISADAAAHRRHVLAFLSVNDAVIAGAQVVDGLEQIDVRFSISGAEKDVDDYTGQTQAGDDTERSWQERWRFTRHPGVDTSASDERHQITDVSTDQWLVAHRGWTVTEIVTPPASSAG